MHVVGGCGLCIVGVHTITTCIMDGQSPGLIVRNPVSPPL